MKKTQLKWIDEFDRRFGTFMFATGLERLDSKDIKSFITKVEKEAVRRIADRFKEATYLKMYLGKRKDDRQYKVYLKAEIDALSNKIIKEMG